MKIDYNIFNQKTAIDRFIFAIKNGYFVEAHELLEALVLKGLINGATALALFHIKKKEEGHKKVWLAFEKYIPLLEEVDFEEKEKYYEAKEFLIKLNKMI